MLEKIKTQILSVLVVACQLALTQKLAYSWQYTEFEASSACGQTKSRARISIREINSHFVLPFMKLRCVLMLANVNL